VYIFCCAGGKFEEVTGVFLTEKHSSDALRGGTGRWPLAYGVLSVYPEEAECIGRTRVSPVLSVRCASVLRPSLRMGPVSTGRYQCLASSDPTGLQSSLRTSPVSTGRIQCEPAERSVVLCQARACASRWRQRSSSNG